MGEVRQNEKRLKYLYKIYKAATNGSIKPVQRGKNRNDEPEDHGGAANTVRDALEHKPFLRELEKLILGIFNEG
jgi:hypothetical protein